MFIETRGNDGIKKAKVSFSEAILNPSASFGGLYVPETLPNLGLDFIKDSINKSYKELAYDILKSFKIDIEDEIIKKALDLYDSFDNNSTPAPVVKVKDNLFINEQWHGPTRAFKDMALQPFGYILSKLAQKRDENYLIMAATSGDTGPATLESFKNKKNIKVVCLYPDGGTSDVQRLQMVTADGDNLKVLGIKGNFDDAQTSLKNLLSSNSFKEKLNELNLKLSAANSVNFGRIIFQIIYHFYSYISLVKNNEITLGDEIYFIVPSGNFGNALGAYYAWKLGVPVKKILIASNENNVLTEWINKGIYDIRDKKLINTKSPAMDILKSSNIERVLFDLFGSDRTKELMDSLNNEKYFKLSESETKKLQEFFGAVYSDDEYGLKTIKLYLEKYNYLMDPHTATTIKAYEEFVENSKIAVAYSTAEWTKFAPSILNAINEDNKKYSDLEALNEISKKYSVKIPPQIKALFDKEVIHKDIVKIDEIEDKIVYFLTND